jgi:hypothetical protein
MRFVAANSQPLNSMMSVHWFEVRNRGRRTCALRGRPDVTVLKTGGYRVRISQVRGTYGESRTFGLRPGHGAKLLLFVGSYCGEPSGPKRPALVVLHAADHDVRVPLTACPSGLDLSLKPFESTDPPPPEQRVRFPFDVSIVGHPHARRGTTLVYRVRLRNRSPRPFRFPDSWCPIVNEWIDGQNGPVFGLNCRPAGTIAPGKSVSFVMHYELSRHYVPGRRLLHWTLANGIHQTVAGAKAEITVDP